uniref:Putative jnk1/mapk8-associated membrane protein n=1 Tax=Xenopsylla cheopis TaxID=163159 RepID=A0A6M2DWC6_XENCH
MHWFCVDLVAKRRSFSIQVFILHLSCLFEVGIAAFITILWVEPIWSFRIKSCGVIQLADWYTLIHNPTPNYEKALHCTQEAVYPLHTMGFVFYGLCIISMLSIRPYLSKKYLPHTGKMAIYYALYFFPILGLLHAVAGGLIYYAFPYITIILSVVSNATHFSFKLDKSMKDLVRSSVADLRNAIIIMGHWIVLAYGIIALTVDKGMPHPFILLTLVPLPTVFYILTSRFTDPNKIHND